MKSQLKKMLRKHLRKDDPWGNAIHGLKDSIYFEIYGYNLLEREISSLIKSFALRLGYQESRMVYLKEDIIQLRKRDELFIIIVTVYRNKAKISISKHHYPAL